jgi:hypothetical protein
MMDATIAATMYIKALAAPLDNDPPLVELPPKSPFT